MKAKCLHTCEALNSTYPRANILWTQGGKKLPSVEDIRKRITQSIAAIACFAVDTPQPYNLLMPS